LLVVEEEVELFEPTKFCAVGGCAESDKWNLTMKREMKSL